MGHLGRKKGLKNIYENETETCGCRIEVKEGVKRSNHENERGLVHEAAARASTGNPPQSHPEPHSGNDPRLRVEQFGI